MEQQKKIYEVLIIGAGAAGIAAAQTLRKRNCPYLILEARDRIGGRVHGMKINGIHVDLGASWVHSYGPKNPIRAYVKELGWKAIQYQERNVGRTYIDGEKHCGLNCIALQKGKFHEQGFFEKAETNSRVYKNDISLWQGGKQYLKEIDSKLSDEVRRSMNLTLNRTEHYEASSLEQLSTRYYEYRKDKGGDFAPCKGYYSLMNKIGEKINVELRKNVVRIVREEDHVWVQCSDQTIYKAKKILVSLPLGVLKTQKVKFEPQLPARHQESINSLGVGIMNKIIMAFEDNFWGSTRWISMAFDEKGKYPHFYNFSQANKHILCCFITDKFALKCEQKKDEEIIEELLDCFKKIYKKNKVKLIDAVITRWNSQEFSQGSYTSFHLGSAPQDCYELRKPVENRLWMMGEHCYAQHIGTAHGAFQTGIMAAEQALKSLKWSEDLKEVKKSNPKKPLSKSQQ